MISDLPDLTEAVLILLVAGAMLSGFMCTAPPAARRDRWRKAARDARLPTLSMLPLILWSSSHVDAGMSLGGWLLSFGLILGAYFVAGVVVSRRLSLSYPEDWQRMKNGAEVDPAMKKLIDDEIKVAVLIATIPAAISALTVWAVSNDF